MVDFDGGILRDKLAEQRRILVSSPLDGEVISALAAQLMAFDGSSSRDVEIIINSPGGPIPHVFPVLDVLDLMRANVNTTAIGSVRGTAVALVAACTGERRAAPHTTFSFRVEAMQLMQGTAQDIARHAEELSRMRARYLTALSAATGQHQGVLAEEIDRGASHTADEAISMGIIDCIAHASR